MRYHCLQLLFLVIACYIGKANGQQQAYFNNLTEKDGLSNNSVTCFFKDKTGYMWIGTENGLNLYSGNNWVVYKPSLHKKNYVSGSYITDIEEDAAGKIWVCTRKGLNCIDRARGVTEVFLPGETLSNSIPSDLIWDAYPDNDSSVWLAADAKALCRYNPLVKKYYYHDFKAYLRNNHFEIKEGYHSIFHILPKSATELWLATTDGIFSFNKLTAAFTLHASIELSRISFFYFDERFKKLYCTGNENKLYCYDPLKKEIKTILIYRSQQSKNTIPPFNAPGKLLFVPAAKGLAAINENNETAYFLDGSTANENDLLMGKINCVYKDREGITWVGTENGVSKFVPSLNNNLHISFANTLALDPDRVIKNFIYSPSRDEWLIASWKDNKIFTVNNITGKTSELQRPAVFSHDTCYAFYAANRDMVYMLSKGSVLIYYLPDRRWEKVTFPSPCNKYILTGMALDLAGNWWVFNKEGKLFIYTPATKKITTITIKGHDADPVRCLASDPGNNCMWIGTSSYGLVKYNPGTALFDITPTDINNKAALHSYMVNDIALNSTGNVWVATFEGGLAKYTTSPTGDAAFTNYDILCGLPDNNIFAVATDKKTGTWFTTLSGIGYIDITGAYKGLYNKQSGLPYSKFMQGIAVSPGGKIAAVTENNFICFDPSAIGAIDNYPLTVDNVLVNDTIAVSNATPGTTQIFSYQQNALCFNFSVLDFISPGAVEYYYMLENFDNGWVYAGKQHTIRYPQLPPGKYTFRVKAKRENGGFYKQEGNFRFYIRPAFWQTIWFKLTLLFLLAASIYWLLKKRVQSVRYNAEMKQKVAEAETIALRSQMNPHFIFNSLNSIDNLIQQNEKEKATLFLARFAKLIRAILENSKYESIPCWKDIETLKLYLEMEGLRWGDKFQYGVLATENIEQGDYKVPPLIVQPYVENAILHGLMNKQGGEKRLLINVSIENNFIKYTIEDNGVGIAKAEVYKVMNRPKHVSTGMELAAKRIQYFNGTETKDVQITNLYDEEGKAAGTRVEVFISAIH